jgi:hypothetical protein
VRIVAISVTDGMDRKFLHPTSCAATETGRDIDLLLREGIDLFLSTQ